MIEIVFHARGGQGAVTAAQILATAAFREGNYAHAFPSFGPERRGAPVTAYARIDQVRIVDRSPIVTADYVIVLAPSILKTSNPLAGLKDSGCAILNVNQPPEDIHKEAAPGQIQVFCIDASMISERVYGKKPIPTTNVAMLGAFASVSDIVQLDAILEAVDRYLSAEAAEKARRTARMAHKMMSEMMLKGGLETC
jgi:2-oxoacid:acceptor oxidoreductase gamma subunit (pyruvate/2-ketoisovalerate family)